MLKSELIKKLEQINEDVEVEICSKTDNPLEFTSEIEDVMFINFLDENCNNCIYLRYD